ncbi:MAG: PEP-CTERM sorting domain-containing protein [Phycisphaerae bacterium]|jgi:hypothetical protein|nr:PEP-CTERM sorting domain-containing protein [Phycisphaerae bacterium]
MKRAIQIVLAVAAFAALMSVPQPARSDCIPQVQLAAAINAGYGGQDTVPATASDSDGHTTGLLPTTSTDWSGVVEASGGYGTALAGVISSIDMGDLSINLTLHTEVNTSTTDGAASNAGASSQISWHDGLKLESSTLPDGTPVDVKWYLKLSGMLVEGGRSYPENGMHAAFYLGGAGLQLWDPGETSALSQLAVGDQIAIQGSMEASAITMANYAPWVPEPPQTRVPLATVDINIRSVVGIEILTPGAGYTSCSGTVYPIPEPATVSLLALGVLGILKRRREYR